jgi:predicted nucleotidyltransferase
MHPVIEQRRDELEQLCSQYRVSSLSLFGSAATAQYDAANSDLDFLVEFQPLPPGTYADTFFGLLETLEHMFERPVDLVVRSAIQNPYFQQTVDQTSVLLYAA